MITIKLDHEDGVYNPGELLECHWRIGRIGLENIQSVEVSILWYTEGKGGEDFSVHKFQRVSGERLREMGNDYQHSVVTELPMSPLSYEGKLLRIRWCARLRVSVPNEPDTLVQTPFYLGYADNQ